MLCLAANTFGNILVVFGFSIDPKNMRDVVAASASVCGLTWLGVVVSGRRGLDICVTINIRLVADRGRSWNGNGLRRIVDKGTQNGTADIWGLRHNHLLLLLSLFL